MEGDRYVMHTLYSAQPGSGDLRARTARTSWPDLLVAKIRANYPEFDMAAALDDTYQPLRAPSTGPSGPTATSRLETVS